MTLSKEMRACLRAYKDGTQIGTPYVPELLDMGLLTWVSGDKYTVVTPAGLEACKEQTVPLRLFDLQYPAEGMWDVYEKFTVLAPDEATARSLANAEHGDEGPIWLDPELTDCVEVELVYAGVVSSSYKA